MKKSLLLLVTTLMILSLTSQSQVVNKGDKLFGGSFSFSFFNMNSTSPSYNSTGNAGVLPSFAWAIKKDLTFGINGAISYSRGTTSTYPQNKNTNSSFTVGPGIFLKKYKLLKDQFGVYFDNGLNAFYTMSRQKITGLPDVAKNHIWGGGYSFKPGVFYKFSDSFLGEANIGGVFASYYQNYNFDSFGVGVSFLQSFNLGINYIIGKKG